MARKKTALLMTVGTGVGTSKTKIDDLAHGILTSIDTYNPDLVIFFGSEDSKLTIESLKRQYEEEFEEEFDCYEFIQIEEIDSFSKYFAGFKDKINELENDYKIIIDYTSGTKTMTMSAAFSSMMFRKKLIFVSGKRKNGTVIRGTEKVITQNLYLIYDELMLTKSKELFNSNRFEAGKTLIEDIVDKKDNEIYSKLFEAYAAFDNVDYVKANENFDMKEFSNTWPEIKKQLALNKKALSIMNTKNHQLKPYYILASLLNNARRRSLESKFDDAIARLYRSLELIGQIRLKTEYDLDSSDIDIDYLKEKGLNEDYLISLESIRDKNSGKIKIGLVQNFKLLLNLNDMVGKAYEENEKKIQNVIKFRNLSILAHGLESKSINEYEEFEKIVLNMANVLNKDICLFIEETKFPEF